MATKFTAEAVEILHYAHVEAEEVHHEFRRGVSLNKYVLEVKPGQTYFDVDNMYQEDPVPEKYIGFWMMVEAYDLQYVSLREAIYKYEWVKVVRKEVTAYEWVIQEQN